MKKCLTLITTCLFLLSGLDAQIGFTTAPTQGFAGEWQVLTENYITHKQADFLKYGITATLDYTFDLKAPEWQFSPAIHASQTQFDYLEHEFRVYTVGVQGNFNFIPFKEGQQKEMPKTLLYIQFSPGIDIVRMRYFQLNLEGGNQKLVEILADKRLAVSGGINLLFDIKLTDLLTITPVTGIRYFPNLEWKGFSKTISENDFSNEYDKVNWRHIIFGLRIGLDLKTKS